MIKLIHKTKKIFLTSIFLFFLGIFLSFSQDKISKLDIRFGIGTSQLNNLSYPEISTVAIESEINYKLSKYFAISGSLNYLFGIPKRYDFSNGFSQFNANFFQISSAIFYSPFKNNKNNDFRVGVGPVWITGYINVDGESNYCSKCQFFKAPEIQTYIKENVLTANFIIEDSYTINEQFIVGLKLYYQPYLPTSDFYRFNENIGLTAKFGIKIFNKKK